MSKKTHKWYNKTILNQEEIPDLEHNSAILEFEQGLPREKAEEMSYNQYRRKHHVEGAAHHLRGLKAAQEAGDIDEAKKHGVAYSLHLGELGHDPMDKVPDEVQKLLDGEKPPKVYKFKSHKADTFLVER